MKNRNGLLTQMSWPSKHSLSLAIRMSLYSWLRKVPFTGDRETSQGVLRAPAVSQVTIVINMPLWRIWGGLSWAPSSSRKTIYYCTETENLEKISYICEQTDFWSVQRQFTGESVVFSNTGRSTRSRSIGWTSEKQINMNSNPYLAPLEHLIKNASYTYM